MGQNHEALVSTQMLVGTMTDMVEKGLDLDNFLEVIYMKLNIFFLETVLKLPSMQNKL